MLKGKNTLGDFLLKSWQIIFVGKDFWKDSFIHSFETILLRKSVETKQRLKSFTFLETKRSAASACFRVSGSLSCGSVM